MSATSAAPIKSVDALTAAPEEYRLAVRKIVRSHAVNELYGARVYDEPAIALAPTPYLKWLTCRIAMEEYGHHVRFRQLGEQMGVPESEMTPEGRKPLSIFEFPLKTWEEFCVIKLLADLAEIIQVEDLMKCSFLPLRNLAKMTMPEEIFHSQFGKDTCTELVKTADGRKQVQAAIDHYFPMMPAFFGKADSANNALYRKYGIKQRTNEDMRTDFIKRARDVVEGHLKLTLPEVAEAA
ncbi:MAG TPA: Phenylacetic acid catabolic protein [Stellaceae bacterium]|nr:Phenylacetic acid catabolic protein [Stellaceae bacterium]